MTGHVLPTAERLLVIASRAQDMAQYIIRPRGVDLSNTRGNAGTQKTRNTHVCSGTIHSQMTDAMYDVFPVAVSG